MANRVSPFAKRLLDDPRSTTVPQTSRPNTRQHALLDGRILAGPDLVVDGVHSCSCNLDEQLAFARNRHANDLLSENFRPPKPSIRSTFIDDGACMGHLSLILPFLRKLRSNFHCHQKLVRLSSSDGSEVVREALDQKLRGAVAVPPAAPFARLLTTRASRTLSAIPIDV